MIFNGNDDNSLELFFDIDGVRLLFKLGLPVSIDPEGRDFLLKDAPDNTEVIARGKQYQRWSNIAVGLLVLGFIG